MGEKDCLISCRDAGLGYDNKPLMEHFNFSVYRGDYVCVVGENGSGKSTLIKTILNLVKPVSGKVELADEIQNGAIGYLPQQTQMQRQFPASVMEVVLSGFLNQSHRTPFYKKEEKKIALGHLRKLGIENLAKECYGVLSGGQQQRVSIARALCMNPKILFFDEPTSALDPQLTGEILKVIKDLAAEHMTMVIVTHEMNFARNVADHIVFMENGVIVEEGAPEELFTSDNQRIKEFLGKFQD